MKISCSSFYNSFVITKNRFHNKREDKNKCVRWIVQKRADYIKYRMNWIQFSMGVERWGLDSLPSHTSLKLSFLPSYLSMRRLFSEITHLRFFLSDELDYSGANPGKYACSGAPRIRTGSVAVPQQERTLPISRQQPLSYHFLSIFLLPMGWLWFRLYTAFCSFKLIACGIWLVEGGGIAQEFRIFTGGQRSVLLSGITPDGTAVEKNGRFCFRLQSPGNVPANGEKQ